MSWSHSVETLKKIGGVWVNSSQVAAIEIGHVGIEVHLKSGSRVTLKLDREQAVLDQAARELFSTEKNNEN